MGWLGFGFVFVCALVFKIVRWVNGYERVCCGWFDVRDWLKFSWVV